ncbi:MAG: hypothetical protein LBR74_04215 [Eubacterium sp.]|jgi:hypothetical protein|nr:hypothetical protein [Eubacterium sp.]
MINPLLIARKEYADILKKICAELETSEPRRQIGNEWSMATFLRSDLKNYMLQTHFVFDVSAFREKDDEFISLLEGIQLQNTKARIIIYAPEYKAGDPLLEKLVNSGYTNVVAGYDSKNEMINSEQMYDDLKECFSKNGLPSKKYNRYIKHTFTQEPVEEPTSYKNSRFTVAVVGTMNRIGVTTYGIHLCDYVARHGGKAAIVMFGSGGELQHKMLSVYLSGAEIEKGFTARGVDFFTGSDLPEFANYNLVVYDFGSNIDNAREWLDSANQITLCGGVKWNELGRQSAAEKSLAGYNYTLAVNFSHENICRNYDEMLKRNVSEYAVMPYSPSLFDATENDEIFESIYSEFIDAASDEEEEYEELKAG